MKPCNFKLNEKREEAVSTPISVIGSDLVVRNAKQIMPSKKPRLSIAKNKESGHSNNVKKDHVHGLLRNQVDHYPVN